MLIYDEGIEQETDGDPVFSHPSVRAVSHGAHACCPVVPPAARTWETLYVGFAHASLKKEKGELSRVLDSGDEIHSSVFSCVPLSFIPLLPFL